MSQPPVPLTPEQQRLQVGRIGQAMAATLAPGWLQLRLEYRAAGRHIESEALLTGADGRPQIVAPTPEVMGLLATLRNGMYVPGRGTWLAAILLFDPVRVLAADFLPDLEPPFRRQPPPVAYQDELRFFPREERFVPGWLRARAGLPPLPVPTEPTVSTMDNGEIRNPRIYDGLAPSGRPLVNREPLSPAERAQVLGYLDAAPVILAARHYDQDLFDQERPPSVPLTFRTDGSWIWPGAVAYYLREHNLTPDPELLAHLRARQFQLPEVSEPAREHALASLTG